MTRLCQFCFNNGEVPSEWRQNIIVPIPKNEGKDPRIPLNYRGISLISVCSKVFADVLNCRLVKWLELNNILVDEQNGFRKERSCLDHIYTLYSVVNNRKLMHQSTFVCFIDIKKAFDNVNRHLLWFKLMQLGINGKFLNAVKALNNNIQSTVRVNNLFTDFFSVNSGVKQGCKMSPSLFAIYINDLVYEINSLKCGVNVENMMVSLLLYADDIALIAQDESSLQRMLNCVDIWCKRWKLFVNRDKTKIVHFRNPSVASTNFKFSCGEICIDVDTKYKYLGFWFSEFLDLRLAVRELCKAAGRALSALYTKFLICGGMHYDVYTKLYQSLVEPVLYYGASIWGVNKYKEVESIQNKACRLFLGTSKNACNVATRSDMGWSSCEVKQKIEVFRYFLKLDSVVDNRLLYKTHVYSFSIKNSLECRIMHLIEILGIENICNFKCSIKKKVSYIKEKLNEYGFLQWFSDLWNDDGKPNGNKLRTYRTYKDSLNSRRDVLPSQLFLYLIENVFYATWIKLRMRDTF